MKTKYFFLAAIGAMTLASCSNDDFVGDTSPTLGANGADDGSIQFTYTMPNATRADISGDAAAKLLGYNFYVMGTKGTEPDDSPTKDVVFDNYVVLYEINTAGTTESNTANWEYVGKSPLTGYAKLSSLNVQTIKYWDYSADQYDFLAFSTGTKKAVTDKVLVDDGVHSVVADGEINVTKINSGASLKNSGIAYTLGIPTVAALKETYITDITEVEKGAAYGKEVTLKFKNLGSKVRVALYETVPGYSVKAVNFYKIDKDEDNATDLGSSVVADANLIGANNNSFPTKGQIAVYFPHVGGDNDGEADYDKASALVTPATGTYDKFKSFGNLNYTGKDPSGYEYEDDIYLGRSLSEATFAGLSAASYYETVFPVSTSYPLTLRVDYTLVSTDGSGEEINVYGAKAVVPSIYTQWLPNYAYTYIFKISDNTNGWTSTDKSDPKGLFPITFDAVVTEATEATGEQKTITTVATPSITTYQQNHDITKNEYSKATKGPDNNVRDIFVQVMHNTVEGATTPVAHLVGSTTYSCEHPLLSASNALLYTVSDATATEAEVMDALEKRTTILAEDDVKGRNDITLTKNTNISITTSIVNGPDDNPITIATGYGNAAKIDMSSATLPANTYAFVYDYTSGSKTVIDEYQPIDVSGGTVGSVGKTYASITTLALNGIAATTNADELVDNDYIYFSKTLNGTSTTTYSYVSVAGKTTLPKGLIKVKKDNASLVKDVTGGSTAVSGTFYFDHYLSNNGKYAVKIIKIVA